jgi:uncharacterized protein (DUF488 family)
MENKTIWTIGHSTYPLEKLITMLKSFSIQLLIDVRMFPGSRRYPQFNKETLATALLHNDINYLHMVNLGGRRKPKADSKNTGWRNESFRGYADYMETDSFNAAIIKLQELAKKQKTCYMCSEALWWRCHRSLVSDYLKHDGWTVIHIMDVGKSQEHSYTSPARIVGDRLVYNKE